MLNPMGRDWFLPSSSSSNAGGTLSMVSSSTLSGLLLIPGLVDLFCNVGLIVSCRRASTTSWLLRLLDAWGDESCLLVCEGLNW